MTQLAKWESRFGAIQFPASAAELAVFLRFSREAGFPLHSAAESLWRAWDRIAVKKERRNFPRYFPPPAWSNLGLPKAILYVVPCNNNGTEKNRHMFWKLRSMYSSAYSWPFYQFWRMNRVWRTTQTRTRTCFKIAYSPKKWTCCSVNLSRW